MRPGGGRGRGVTSLFAGDSGTGKTMSAEVIAADLGLDLYSVDLATVTYGTEASCAAASLGPAQLASVLEAGEEQFLGRRPGSKPPVDSVGAVAGTLERSVAQLARAHVPVAAPRTRYSLRASPARGSTGHAPAVPRYRNRWTESRARPAGRRSEARPEPASARVR